MKLLSQDTVKRRATQIGVSLIPSYVRQNLVEMPLAALKTDAPRARIHPERQLAAMERSILSFGFTMPLLVTSSGEIVAGAARAEAARRIGMVSVPTLLIDGMTDDQIRAYRLADNRLAELSSWDEKVLKLEFEHLLEVDLDFGIETIGWDPCSAGSATGGARRSAHQSPRPGADRLSGFAKRESYRGFPAAGGSAGST